MRREKMAGVNLHEGNAEVAFELWAEQSHLSRLHRSFLPLKGKRYRIFLMNISRTGRAQE